MLKKKMQPKCVICDPSLVMISGHHLNMCLSLQSNFKKVGYSVETFISKNASDKVVEFTGGSRHFSHSVYDVLVPPNKKQYYFSQLIQLLASRKMNAEFQRKLSLLPFDKYACHDVILFPTVSQNQIDGIAKWFDALPSDQRPRVVIWLLLNPTHVYDDDPKYLKLASHLYRRAFNRFKRSGKSDLGPILLCETRQMSELYGSLSGFSVKTKPVPKLLNKATAKKKNYSENEKVTIGLAGHAHPAKGYSLLPEIVELVHAQNPKILFNIHGSTQYCDARTLTAMNRLREMGKNVVVETGELCPKKYQEWLLSCDLILLPYNSKNYAIRGSGVFEEAEKLCIPMVVPRNCAFSEESLRTHKATGFEGYSPQSIARAVLEAVSNIHSLQDACNEDRSVKNVDFSSIDELMDFFASFSKRGGCLD